MAIVRAINSKSVSLRSLTSPARNQAITMLLIVAPPRMRRQAGPADPARVRRRMIPLDRAIRSREVGDVGYPGPRDREAFVVLILSVLVLVIGVLAAPGLLTSWQTSEFQSSLASGLLATFAGATGGVPLGLYVGRRLQSRADAAKLEQHQADRLARRSRLLVLLRDELASDLALFRQGMPLRQAGQQLVVTLSEDMWRASSDAGDLGLIGDLGLMHAIAEAYRYVRLVARYEDLAMQSRYLTSLTYDGVPAATITLRLVAHEPVERAVLTAIEGAIDAIDGALAAPRIG